MRTHSRNLAVSSIVLALVVAFGARPAAAAEKYFLGFKSPGPGMHVTAGLPVQVWADIIPRGNNDHVVECHWDNKFVARAAALGNDKPFDYFPLAVPGELVTPGVHRLELKSTLKGGDSHQVFMYVQVDPWPADKKVVELKEDLTAADLDWTNVAVKGNGHTVKVSGKLTIKNSLITGLGSLKGLAEPATTVMTAGITGTLTGDVTIQDSIFEATGALRLTINGDGQVNFKNTDWRASNFVKFVPSDPEATPIIQLSGSNAKRKLFQGNRIASGRVVFDGMSNWLIGSDEDANEADGNILMGPRCTINMFGCSKAVVRGNYSHHNYRGQWSQGYNFVFGRTSDLLVEHNMIEDSSWPVQDLGGEFRYNVVLGYGHTWIRTLQAGTVIHHNIFAPNGEGGLGFGIESYLSQRITNVKNVKVYNNTFDGGAKTGDFAGGFIGISHEGIEYASVRNNLFTYARDVQNDSPGKPLVTAAKETILYADHNAFYSPDSKQKANYSPEAVRGKKQGEDGFAAHDVSGKGDIGTVNGRLDAHPFAGKRFYPYTVDEGAVWNRMLKLSQVMAEFRERYTPAKDSSVIDKGDPADGKGVDIGAIEAPGGTQRPEDKFAKFVPPAKDTTAPTVALTAPKIGTAVSGAITLTAEAKDDVGVTAVQFFADDVSLGEVFAGPYSVTFDSQILGNGKHTLTARAFDAAGNSKLSEAVTITIKNPEAPASGPSSAPK